MGQFVVPQNETIEAKLEAAIDNIKLYLTLKNNNQGDHSYLLDDFAIPCIEQGITDIRVATSNNDFRHDVQ